MEINETVDPLPLSNPNYIVGLTYNLKKGIISEVEDIEAEYDQIDTIMAIKAALEKANCQVELMEADELFFKKIIETKVDIVFNIAEGTRGRGREAQVPAVLNFLNIPFTGSDETTLCIALDKALAKRILASFKVKTPKYQLIVDKNTRIMKNFKFPVIIKPNAEGSSKGISDLAIVDDMQQLKDTVKRMLHLYEQPILIEEYIQGREFTVGVIGDGKVLSPMEISYKNAQKYNIYSYNVKKNCEVYIDYICPAELDKNLEQKIVLTAKKIYQILQCRDFARIDFLLTDDGNLYFIEINPLPGLAPNYSDFPMLAGFNGVSYDELIIMVLNSALKRYNLAPVSINHNGGQANALL